jgi:hypothetical protein
MPQAQPIPLGIRIADHTGLLCPVAACDVLIVAEGEPDWLSMHDAVSGVGVLGICDVAGGWRSAWSELLRKPRAVVVAVHAPHNDAITRAVVRAFKGLHGQDAVRRVVSLPFPEDYDANVHHCDGRLLAAVAPALREVCDA